VTICASVKVRDGLVLGTDSMTQIWGEDPAGNRGIIKTYSNAPKLFQVGKLPIGVMTYGIGNLGPRSIQAFIREFGDRHGEAPDVSEVSQELFTFFSEAYGNYVSGTPAPALGFYVAGHTPGEDFPSEFEFLLPRDQTILEVRPPDKFGASWRGVDVPFTRLYKGFDPRMFDALIKQGIEEQVLRDASSKFESPVAYDGMPVQDAINFVAFIVETTIGLATFELGPASCGGPLQIALILPDEGFKWISRLEPTLEPWTPYGRGRPRDASSE
jgi:hypothetical protein